MCLFMYQVLSQAEFIESTRSGLVKPWKNIYEYDGCKEVVESEL